MGRISSILDISRRMGRHFELGRGMGLSADDVEMLVEIGVYDLIQQKAAEYAKEQSQQRRAAKLAIVGGTDVSPAASDRRWQRDRPAAHESGKAAIERALAMRPAATASTSKTGGKPPAKPKPRFTR